MCCVDRKYSAFGFRILRWMLKLQGRVKTLPCEGMEMPKNQDAPFAPVVMIAF